MAYPGLCDTTLIKGGFLLQLNGCLLSKCYEAGSTVKWSGRPFVPLMIKATPAPSWDPTYPFEYFLIPVHSLKTVAKQR